MTRKNEEKELMVQKWFEMWLNQNSQGIEELFCRDAIYVESWGPKYTGLNDIRHWFEEWNTRGSVKTWEIKQFFHKDEQTIVEWYFCNSTGVISIIIIRMKKAVNLFSEMRKVSGSDRRSI